MSEECYFEIYMLEDGVHVKKIELRQMEYYLNEASNQMDDSPLDFLSNFPLSFKNGLGSNNQICLDCPLSTGEVSPREIILIKGKIVQPKIVQVIKKMIIEDL